MSQQTKGALHRLLKEQGVEFAKHYRDYTENDFLNILGQLNAQREAQGLATIEFTEDSNGAPETPSFKLPEISRDPNEMAGVRQNTNPELEPIRRDPETGHVWYQEEVRKAAFAKPRGRRVLSYTDTGSVVNKIVGTDGTTETFEVAGKEARAAQAKITLPSYQVGIYKDERFPFKIHVYNEDRGFDLFEVQQFYGGEELVPTEIKRKYVENVLCYDIRTVVRAITTEDRQRSLAASGRIDLP